MTSIYSIYRNQPVSKGLVEIINLYENRYFHIALDGVIIDSIYKQSFETTILKKSFIKKCVKSSGISEENLVFVNVEWMDLGDENISDYDANDFDKYEKFIDFLNQNPNVKWKNKLISFVKVLAIGVTELERKL